MKADFLKLAQEAYSGSERYMDNSLRGQWERNLRQWQSIHSSDSKYSSDAFKGRSRLFRPRTRAVIRKNEAACAAAFFSTQDVISIEPEDDSDEYQLMVAELVDSIANYRLQKSIPWFQLVNGAYQSGQVYGVVCSYQYWLYDGKQDKPCIDLIPPENIRIDPASDWLDPINSSPYVIHLIPMYVSDIKQRMNTIDEKTGEPEWNKAEDKLILSAANEYYDSTRIQREQGRQDNKQNFSTDNMDFMTAWVRRNIIRHEGQDWVFYTLGGEFLLSEPKPLEEVYYHGERPYVMGCVVIEANKTYPSGIPQLTHDVQNEINDVCNQRMDNVKFVLNKRYFAKRGAQVDLNSLTRNMPGSVTLMNDPETDVVVHSTPDVTSSSFQEQDRLNLDFDDLSGTFSGSSVQANRNMNETVGGMNLMSQGANQLAEYQLRTFTETWVEPVLRQLIKLIMHYETDTNILSLAGKKSKLFQQFQQAYGIPGVTDDMLKGDLVVNVNVGTGATNPQTQVERFFFGLNSLAGVLGENFINKVDTEEVIAETFGKLGYKDGKRFFNLEEGQDPKVAQLEQMVQELQMQLQQKRNPELDAAQIKKLEAEAERVKAETTVKGVEGLYSSLQAAQTVATIPGVAPIADEIYQSAGGVDKNGYPIATPPEEAARLPTRYSEQVRINTDPRFPANPESPVEGVNQGIETMENDGV
jgi:hypothetical protein